MSDFTVFVVLGIIALAVHWPSWVWIVAFTAAAAIVVGKVIEES